MFPYDHRHTDIHPHPRILIYIHTETEIFTYTCTCTHRVYVYHMSKMYVRLRRSTRWTRSGRARASTQRRNRCPLSAAEHLRSLTIFLDPFVWRSRKHGVKITRENNLRDRRGRISAAIAPVEESERCIPRTAIAAMLISLRAFSVPAFCRAAWIARETSAKRHRE